MGVSRRRYPWGVQTPSSRLAYALDALEVSRAAIARARFPDLLAATRRVIDCVVMLLEVLDHIARTGMRVRGARAQDRVAAADVVRAASGLREASGALALSSVLNVSRRYADFEASLEEAVQVAARARAKGVRGDSGAPVTDVWSRFGS